MGVPRAWLDVVCSGPRIPSRRRTSVMGRCRGVGGVIRIFPHFQGRSVSVMFKRKHFSVALHLN